MAFIGRAVSSVTNYLYWPLLQFRDEHSPYYVISGLVMVATFVHGLLTYDSSTARTDFLISTHLYPYISRLERPQRQPPNYL